MNQTREVLVLGIGNVLWADEGFGVRAVEELHARYAFPSTVTLLDGGTQGLYLYDTIASAQRVLLFDAIDFRLSPGTLRVVRDADVPSWTTARMSPHQNGFNDVLALARLRGEAPRQITLVGVQPDELEDLGGSLTGAVRSRIGEAVEIAAAELAQWGFAGTPREAGDAYTPLNAPALAIDAYERGRPAEHDACRIGDARVLTFARYRSHR